MGRMNHSGFRAATPVVINGAQITPIELDGERVLTLAMIDKAHSRADGTARRNFNEHRDRLVIGEDYRELTADEIRTQSLGHVFAPRTPKGIVLTESGYLMLVKSFNDDLAWKVQKQLVRTYFKAKREFSVARTTPRMDVSRECRLSMAEGRKWAKEMGLTGNQAIIAANRLVNGTTGIDPLGLMGITHMDAPQNQTLLSPTEIGKRIGSVTPQTVNDALCRLGLQFMFRDSKGKIYYEPTDAGIEAGGVMQDTERRHSSGAPVRQLRWASSVIHIVDEDLQRESAL